MQTTETRGAIAPDRTMLPYRPKQTTIMAFSVGPRWHSWLLELSASRSER